MPPIATQEEWSKYWDKAYGYYFRRISHKSQIEDLTTETLHAFFLTELEVQNPNAFFWSIVRNKFLAFIKAKSSQNSQSQIVALDENTEFSLSDNIDDYDPFYNQKILRLLECVQSQLSDQDASIVEMSIMCDFGSQRVAQELNLSAGNVRVRLTRALSKLRQKCRQIWE